MPSAAISHELVSCASHQSHNHGASSSEVDLPSPLPKTFKSKRQVANKKKSATNKLESRNMYAGDENLILSVIISVYNSLLLQLSCIILT